MTGRVDSASSLMATAIIDDRLVDALGAPRQAGFDPEEPLVLDAIRCVEAIAAVAGRHRPQIVDALAGIGTVSEPPDRQQRPVLGVRVPPTKTRTARDALIEAGYEPIDRISDGAWRSMERVRSDARFTSSAGDGVQVRLSWAPVGGPATRDKSVLTPRLRDWKRVDLPGPAWPAYNLVRMADIAARRFRSDGADFIGPHLPTPTCLVEPLLRFAELGPDDVLLDLGSGDGRVLIEAARALGIGGLGIELDSELVEIARHQAEAAGVADRVEFVCADASTASLGRATAAFFFLPPQSAPRMLRLLQERLPAGAVVIAHEQASMPGMPAPDASAPVFADEALTVGYRWTAGHS